MQNIPPPPPGFTLDTPGASPPAAPSLGRPIIRKGVEPKQPRKQLQNGYIVDLDAGTAAPVPGLPPAATTNKTSYSPMTAEEIAGLGLPPGAYQKSSEGKIERIGGDGKGSENPALKQQQQAQALLTAAGVDLEKGVDPIADLIKGSTSGSLQKFGADAYGAITGDATDGMENIGKLQTLVSDMTLQLTGGGLGNQISNADRDFIMQRVGNLADPSVPASQRLAAWEQVKQRMGNQLGIQPGQPQDDNDDAGAAPGGAAGAGSPPASPSFTPSTDGTRSVIDPKKQELGNKIAGLVSRGADRNTIMGFAVRADPSLRDDSKFNAWVNEALQFRQQQPKSKFTVDPSFYTTQVPLNGAEQVLNAAAQTDVGGDVAAYGVGAGNAVTAGLLDEIVGLTGGDADRAQQNKEFIRDTNPIPSFLGEMTGAALGMKGLNKIPSIKPLAADIGFGAAYGAGESNDNRLGGAVLGGGAAFAGNKAANALGDLMGNLGARRAARNAEGREVIGAADRLGIDVLPADVGGTVTRKLTGGAAQGPVSAVPIVRAARRASDQAQAARDTIASKVGKPLSEEAAGQVAQQGAKGFISRTSKRGNDLYKRAESLAGKAQVEVPKAVAKLDEHIAELEQIPGGTAGLQTLRDLRETLAGKKFSVAGIRGMRTQLRDQFIKDGLRGSDLERRVKQVVEAASDDIASGLADQGLQNASGVYKQADRYWRSRLKTIDDVIDPIVSGKSGEQVMKALEGAANGGNAARLSSFIKTLDSDEQATVRATFISKLGKASKGRQNDTGDGFSLNDFLTHWSGLSDGAKKTLFQGEVRRGLDDLAKVANGTKEAQRHNNFSNTAGGWTAQAAIAGIPYMAGNLPAVVLSVGSQYLTGRVLASPSFARWLVGAGKATNKASYIDKLQKVAGADAAIATEITGLRQAILSGANDNRAVQSVAASTNGEGGDNERR